MSVLWCRLERMFESIDQWQTQAHSVMAKFVEARRQVELAEARAAELMGEVIEAYAWPAEILPPDRMDCYKAMVINDRAFGEDLSSEIALAMKVCEGTARYMVGEVCDLVNQMPNCWAKVTDGEACLWQARMVAREVDCLDEAGKANIDNQIAPCLGTLSYGRLMNQVEAAIKAEDPDRFRRREKSKSDRRVHIGGDKHDLLSGWVSARLDRAETIFLETTVSLLAERIANDGDDSCVDIRRAKALGMLANPAAAVQLLGVHFNRGMDPVLATEADKKAFVEAAKDMIPVLTPRTQLYIHFFADNLDVGEALARVESIGPVLKDQVASLTKSTQIHLSRVIHTEGNDIGVDQYEIPARIREQVVLRNSHCVFPWSSVESRHLDLDHTIAYQVGGLGQTRPSNLGPLTRRAHRVKTHAGWKVEQVEIGVFLWRSPSGQLVLVDRLGSHTLYPRE